MLSGGTFIIGYEGKVKSGVIVPMQNKGTATLSAAGYLYSGTGNDKAGNGTLDMSQTTATSLYEVEIAASSSVDSAVTIKCGGSFVGNTNTKNNLKLFSTESKTTAFTPSVKENDVFELKICANTTYHTLQYNPSSPRFACYGGGQKNVVIYKKTSGGDTPVTPVNLVAPTNLAATNVTATTATLSWDKVEKASSYTLKIGDREIENAVSPYTAEGLTASTEYTWSIKAIGDGSRYISSGYAENVSFTTQKEGTGVIVINADAIADFTNAYKEYEWAIGSFSGKCFAYLSSGNMQFNKTPYVYNTTAIPGRIKSVKITKGGGSGQIWSVYMSDKALTSSEKGEQVGKAQTVSSSYTWIVPKGKNYQYFYIEKGTNSTQISSIEVEYEPAPTLTSLAISGTPTQTTYQEGDAFDPTGLVVTGTYDDGSTQEITSGVTWTVDPEKLTTSTTSVEVMASVGNVTSEVFTVNGLTVKEKVTLIGIEVKGTSAEFWKGDEFNHDGITVTALWSDEAEEDVTSKCEFSTPDMTQAGKQTVTVTYLDGTATYEIEVKTIANTQETAYTVAEAIALIDANKDLKTPVYVKGIVSKIVTPFDSQYGNVSFNVSADGSADGAQFQFFRTQKDAENKYTEDPNIEVGASVIGCGTLFKYKDKNTDEEIYEFSVGNYLVSYTSPCTAQTLTFVAQANDAYWATFSSDKVAFMPSSDVDVYTVVVEGGKLATMSGADEVFGKEGTLTVDGKNVKGYYIPANTGVLLYSLEENLTYYTVDNKTVDAVDADFNMLQPACKAMSEIEDCVFFKLAYNDYKAKTGLGFYYGAADGAAFNVKAGTAYLAVPTANIPSSGVKGFVLDGMETGINGVEAEAGSNAAIYNLQGQRVQRAQHGLYIMNGKKYMVK